MKSVFNLHGLSTEAKTLSHLPNCTKLGSSEARRRKSSDDYIDTTTGAIIEEKNARGGTVNQVHVLKADVIIISLRDDNYLVMTMGEILPHLRRQHSFSHWDCGSVSVVKLWKYTDPVKPEGLAEAVKQAEERHRNDIVFQVRKNIVKKLLGSMQALLNDV